MTKQRLCQRLLGCYFRGLAYSARSPRTTAGRCTRSGLGLGRLRLGHGPVPRRAAAVLRGGDAYLLQEEAREVALRREAELRGKLGDLALPGGQARHRGLDAQHVEIGARREAGAELEQIVEARARQADLARELVDVEVLVRARAQQADR